MKYTIMAGEKGFDALRFVTAAASTEDTRKFMQGLHVEDNGRAVATDGRRMHVVSIGDVVAPGDYWIVKSPKTLIVLDDSYDLTFPDWRRVLNRVEVKHRHKIEFSAIRKKDPAKYSKELSKLFIAMKPGIVNIDYLLPLEGRDWIVGITGNPTEPVLFTSGEWTALIAGMAR